jgi:hypothetical protein
MSAAFHPTPIPWTEFPAECLWYLVLMSVLHIAAFIVGCVVIVALPVRRWDKVPERIGRLMLFIGLFLLMGALFNGLWSCLIWDRLYDSTDYVVDFMPFWPITQGVIDAPWGDERGRLLGGSLFQLQLVWLLFAVGTWGVTIFLYRRIRGLGGQVPQAATAADAPEVPPGSGRGGSSVLLAVAALCGLVTGCVPIPTKSVVHYGVQGRLVEAGSGVDIARTNLRVTVDGRQHRTRSNRRGEFTVAPEMHHYWTWLGGPVWANATGATVDTAVDGYAPYHRTLTVVSENPAAPVAPDASRLRGHFICLGVIEK